MKKVTSVLLSLALLAPALVSFGGCSADKDLTLRVYNWEEYIDEGGEGSYDYDYAEEGEEVDDRPILDKFEEWYEAEYGKSIRVEYSTFGTNEDLYNQLKLGDKYDLVCPSEYMIMKLAAEGMLQPLNFDLDDKHNDYRENVSPFIQKTFKEGEMKVLGKDEPASWSEYAAGYMWGVTGLVYNPDLVNEDDLAQGWSIMLDSTYKNKVTTKDNVRDSYFVGLAILYRDELLQLKKQHADGELSDSDYNGQVTKLMNDTAPETVEKVTKILKNVKANIYGFETDTGKSDMVTGKISINFAWSGDAVYAMDVAEGEKKPVYLNFYVPDECANLYFDGWAMPKDESRDKETEKAAIAFINYMSRPDNAIRNSYYIGYTSVIAGAEMFEYAKDLYCADDGDDTVEYDVSYFFGSEEELGQRPVIYAPAEQLKRQLSAQYPLLEVVNRCAVMDYYGNEEDAINELWTQVKSEQLSTWAIVVIVLTALAIILFVIYKFFGSKIELRLKPKKGYQLVKQEKLK